MSECRLSRGCPHFHLPRTPGLRKHNFLRRGLSKLVRSQLSLVTPHLPYGGLTEQSVSRKEKHPITASLLYRILLVPPLAPAFGGYRRKRGHSQKKSHLFLVLAAKLTHTCGLSKTGSTASAGYRHGEHCMLVVLDWLAVDFSLSFAVGNCSYSILTVSLTQDDLHSPEPASCEVPFHQKLNGAGPERLSNTSNLPTSNIETLQMLHPKVRR